MSFFFSLRLILGACGCEDYDEKVKPEVKLDKEEDDDDDEEEDEVEEEDEDEENKKKTGKKNDKKNDKNNKINNILKFPLMVKKLHADPGSFSALTDSLKVFLKSLPIDSERTILTLYIADR